MAENLDEICERASEYFTTQIMELSNPEVAYVLEQLIAKFDGLLERVNEASMNEG